MVPATAALMLALLTLGPGNGNLSTAFVPSLALAEPQLATYLTAHSPHNILALNEASLASTTTQATPSTASSLLGTNTVSP
jgi:hypothetical protein